MVNFDVFLKHLIKVIESQTKAIKSNGFLRGFIRKSIKSLKVVKRREFDDI